MSTPSRRRRANRIASPLSPTTQAGTQAARAAQAHSSRSLLATHRDSPPPPALQAAPRSRPRSLTSVPVLDSLPVSSEPGSSISQRSPPIEFESSPSPCDEYPSATASDDGEHDDIIGLDTETQQAIGPHQLTGHYKQKRRGPYVPKRTKEWALHFRARQPTLTEDHSIVVNTKEENRITPRSYVSKSISIQDDVLDKELRKYRLDDPIADSEGEPFNQSDIDALVQEWQFDIPVMEYPFLQAAFPYETYRPPKDRIVTESYQSLSDPLPPMWYRPQGRLPEEDFFSSKKLSYATAMLRKIKVDADSLRMDIYYQRGFDMAAKQVLDRIRAENYKTEKARENVNPGQADESTLATSNSQADHTASGEPLLHSTSSSSNLQQPSASDEPQEALQEFEPHSSTPPSPGLGPHREPSDRGEPALDTTDVTMDMTPIANNTRAKRNRNNGTVNANNKGSTTGPSTSSSSSTTTQTTPGAHKRMDPNSDIRLEDYYQVNTYLASLFQQPHTVKSYIPTPLSPGACRILQTLLMNLETKVIGMGCQLQRAELTRRLAKVDIIRKRRVVVDEEGDQYKRQRKVNMEEFIYRVPASTDIEEDTREEEFREQGPQETFQMGGTEEGEEESGTDITYASDLCGRSLPFVSNPLRIPECMDPFLKARDFLQSRT
ncbi:MAG: hypothetical protein J3Q66DRAFT_321830 [Benniella sp.]|nr:MAG: hypothetical protein J3Q66DRAFT_321830 [Benniella sp.]